MCESPHTLGGKSPPCVPSTRRVFALALQMYAVSCAQVGGRHIGGPRPAGGGQRQCDAISSFITTAGQEKSGQQLPRPNTGRSGQMQPRQLWRGGGEIEKRHFLTHNCLFMPGEWPITWLILQVNQAGSGLEFGATALALLLPGLLLVCSMVSLGSYVGVVWELHSLSC